MTTRYGHAAVADLKNMYIIGGFTGTMHNDILKFTPGNFFFIFYLNLQQTVIINQQQPKNVKIREMEFVAFL